MMHQVLAASGKTTRRRKAKRATKDPAAGTPVALENIAPESVEALNALYRRRQPVEMTVAREMMAVAPVWPLPAHEPSSQTAVAFTIGDASGELSLPRARIEQWLFQADPDLALSRLAPAHAALLLESLLGGELAWLEEKLECPIRLTAIGDAASPGDVTSSAFSFDVGQEEGFGTLRIADPARLAEIGRLLDAAAKETVGLPPELPMPLRVYRGAVTVGIGDLQSLTPGDVVLLDDVGGEVATELIVIGDRLVAPVELSGEGARLLAPPKPFTGSKWEWIMGPKTDQAQPLDDAGLEDLPVSLVFELGRGVLPLGDVKRLAPGSIIPLPDVTTEAVDVIANGKNVGRGEIVRIGESLGVRVVRIFNNA